MKRIFSRLQNTGAAHRGTVILLAFLSVLQSLLQVGMAVASSFVIDAALVRNGQLLLWGGVLCADLLVLIVVHTAMVWIANSRTDKGVAALQTRLLRTALSCDPESLQHYHSGALLSRSLEDVRTVCDGIYKTLPGLIGQVVRLIGALAAVLILCPRITPVLLIAGVAIAAVTAAFRKLARRLHRNVRKADEAVTAGLQENYRQVTLIRSLQMEEPVLDRFDNKIRRSLGAKFTRRFWTVGVNSAISSLSLLGTGALLLWGAVQVAAGSISYGVLTAMVQLLTLFRGPLLGISGAWTQLAAVEVAEGRLKEILDKSSTPPQKNRQISQVEAVVFENVTFRYPEDTETVLRNFSAELPLNRWTCLTGTSGIGKSTLYKLILGLYRPQKGRVYLKTDQGDVPCGEDTRHLFAYVPQDYALLSGTVLENMRLVAPHADEEARRAAYKLAGADFVWSLSDGEQTQVLENNTGLSMGQLQRLAIARAILMKRPILLLDECTSALDAQTEADVLKGLMQLGTQAIVVTHHPEALQDTDGIAYVDM